MNPLLLLIVSFIFSKQGKLPIKGSSYIKMPSISKSMIAPPSSPPYFDTFKMELVLDRLKSITDALDKVNHLNQTRALPPSKENSINRIQESLDAAKSFLSDTKSEKQIDVLSNTISGVKQFKNMEGLLSNMGPILSLLGSNDENEN